MQPAYLMPSASSVESGSSFRLVSGSRKLRTPLMTVRVLKTMVGIDQWYTANMLSSGETNPPARLAIEPSPEAVCLEQERKSLTILNSLMTALREKKAKEMYFFAFLHVLGK